MPVLALNDAPCRVIACKAKDRRPPTILMFCPPATPDAPRSRCRRDARHPAIPAESQPSSNRAQRQRSRIRIAIAAVTAVSRIRRLGLIYAPECPRWRGALGRWADRTFTGLQRQYSRPLALACTSPTAQRFRSVHQRILRLPQIEGCWTAFSVRCSRFYKQSLRHPAARSRHARTCLHIAGRAGHRQCRPDTAPHFSAI